MNFALAGRLPARAALARAMARHCAGRELATRTEAASTHALESPNINWRKLFIPWWRGLIPEPRAFTPALSEGFCEDLIFTLYKRLGLFIRKQGETEMADFIPPSDADFDAWLTNFVDYVVANAVALGATPAQVTSLQAVKTDWDTKYPASTTAQASAASAVQAKSDSRSATEDLVRPFVGMLQSNSGVTDAQRQSMGITVRSGTRTPVGPPSSKPIASIDTSQRLRHTISFVDELTPTSRAKPDGVQGCEIWMKVGDPSPGGPNDVHYLALDTRTPYVTDFEAADAGKTAYYMLRWLSTRGETGPWSQTVSGTITN